jgi:cathepsin L
VKALHGGSVLKTASGSPINTQHELSNTITMIFLRLGVLLAALTAASATSTPPRAHQLNEAYTFSEYLAHFSKSYSNPEEYARRSQIFYSNLKKILAHNEGRMDSAGKVKEGYVMGVNRFTDQEVHEIPMGYNKAHKAYRGPLEAGGVVTAMERRLDGTASYSVGSLFDGMVSIA